MTRDPSFVRSWWCLRTNHHVTVRRTPEQRQPRPTTRRREAPRSTSLRSRPSSRVRGGGPADVQQPPGQIGHSYGAPPASQSHTRGRSSHGLPPGCHGPSGGEECSSQFCHIQHEAVTCATDLISLHAATPPHPGGGRSKQP
jgi:hypothetical protein